MKIPAPFLVALIVFHFQPRLTSYAASLDEWVWRNPTPQGHTLLDVAYGNGVYVAVGDGGTIMSSTDGGATWAIQNGGGNLLRELSSVEFINDEFIAVGNESFRGLVATSADGTQWAETIFTDNNTPLTGIAFGNGVYVAVNSSKTFTSADAADWTRHEVTAGSEIAFGNGVFVAVGRFGSFSGLIRTSPDGVVWDTIREDVPSVVQAIVFGNNLFVAAGTRYAYVSSDGQSWTDYYQNNDFFTPLDLAFHGGVFYAAGPIVYSSTDGETWSTESLLVNFGLGAFGIEVIDGSGVCAGLSGSLWRRAEGEWTQTSLGERGSPLEDVAFGNGAYVATSRADNAGSQGGLLISSDAVAWSAVQAGQDMGGVVYADGRFVAVGATYYGSGTMAVYTSTDGVSFTPVDLQVAGKLNDVAYGGGLYLAVGTGGRIYSSPDAMNWAAEDSGVTVPLNNITYGNGRFVVTGGFGTPLLESADGMMWNSPLEDSTFLPRAVAFGGDMFMAVAANRLYTSPEGLVWTEQSTPAPNFIQRLVYLDGRFIGVGNSFLQSTVDGANWAQHDVGTVHRLSSIAFDGTSFVLVGYDDFGGNPSIWQSISATPLEITFTDPQWAAGTGFRFNVVSSAPAQVEIWANDHWNNWMLLDTVSAGQTPTPFVDETSDTSSVRVYRGEQAR